MMDESKRSAMSTSLSWAMRFMRNVEQLWGLEERGHGRKQCFRIMALKAKIFRLMAMSEV
ncbi:hypothetical protein C2845_PM14G09960 [Panicum miliaceum]|uniref:Uncharacterized protein n=1 Tax=Panicum miliaceum TaxID=4540 RepID=A0A3L6PNN6_PANMI|nr:hypothetical protein C2845_PM14G09960 [Panicum miliaceum]